jgi:GTP-binding protein EngB required for normal cell division
MPPVVNLVDFPGYGLAVANDEMKTEWKRMTYIYVKNRPVITKSVFLFLSFFYPTLVNYLL